MRTRTFLGVATITIIFGIPVFACTCDWDPNPPCSAFGEASIIFEGRVVAFERKSRNVKPFVGRMAKFQVSKVHRGLPVGEINVYTGENSANCGIRFVVGQQYFVYANQHDGIFTTWSCSRTRLQKEAQEDIDFFASFMKRPLGVSIFGSISREEPGVGSIAARTKPFPNVVVKVRGPQQFEMVSDNNGKFRKDGLPPGRYEVEASDDAPGLRLVSAADYFPRPIFIKSAADRGCIEGDFLYLISDK